MSAIASLPLLLGLVGPLSSQEAHAEPRGIVARVVVGEGASGTPSQVNLVPTGDSTGETVEIELNDAGEAPDVEGEDGIFSGTLWVEGETFDVTLLVDGDARPVGSIEWSVEDEQRDLNITLVGDEVTISADVKQPLPPQPDGSASGENFQPPPGEGGVEGAPQPPPGEAGAPPPAGGGQPMALGTGEQPDGSAPQSSGLLQVLGLILGLLAILTVVWWWRQPPEDDEGMELPEGVSLQPEGGFLGEGTPSLSHGVTVFGVSRADGPLLVAPLLGTLARTRSVAASVPATLELPSVLGGPVYKVRGGKEVLKDTLATLSHDLGTRVVGFVVAEGFDAAALAALSSGLPAGVGVAVLAIEPAADLDGVVTVRRDGGDGGARYGQCWVFSSQSAKEGELIDAIDGPEGLTRIVEA